MSSGSSSGVDGVDGATGPAWCTIALDGIAPLPVSAGVRARMVEIGSLHANPADCARLLHRAGRAAAAALLAQLGAPSVDVPRALDGAPRWPEGYTGSISHSGRLIAAAVCSTHWRRSLGIDLEAIPTAEAAAEVAAICLSPEERRACREGVTDTELGTVLAFAAKEALFKCLAPVCGQHFDFLDVQLTRLDLRQRRIRLRQRTALAADLPEGRWHDAALRWNRSHVFAAVELAP